MGIYFNTYCHRLDNLKILNEGKELGLHAKQVNVNGQRAVLLSLSDDTEACKLLLEMDKSGICHFTPYRDGKLDAVAKYSESYDTAHYDYGFYHYAYGGRAAYCSYRDHKVVTIAVHDQRLYINAKLPTQVRNGIVLEEFKFSESAHQLLVCIAKLCGNYAFSNNTCAALDAICPKVTEAVPVLTEFQLKKLKEEYPVAYEKFMNRDGMESVIPMIRDIITKWGQG